MVNYSRYETRSAQKSKKLIKIPSGICVTHSFGERFDVVLRRKSTLGEEGNFKRPNKNRCVSNCESVVV